MSEQEPNSSVKTVSIEEYEKAIDKARNLEAQVVDFQKRFGGIDPERYRALDEEVSILRKESAGGDPKKIDALLEKQRKELEATLEKRFSTKLTETEKALADRDAKLKRLMVMKPAMMAAVKYFNDDQLSLLEPVIEASLDLEGDEIIVKGPDGNPAPSVREPRNPRMAVDEFLESLAAKFPSSARPSMHAGAKQPGIKMPPTSGRSYSLDQLAQTPDKGKQAFKEMGPEKTAALFQKH